MNKRYKYLAFDLDGTLYDAMPFLQDSYKDAINELIIKKELDITCPSKEALINEIGNPVALIMKNLFPSLNKELVEELGELIMVKIYLYIQADKGNIYEGVKETIIKAKEKGYTLLLTSNGRFAYIDAVLKQYKLLEYFEDIVAIDNVNYLKKSDILNEYINRFSIIKENLVMIGDRHNDEEAAIEVNCDFIWCKYGHGDNNDIKDPIYTLNKMNDLLNII